MSAHAKLAIVITAAMVLLPHPAAFAEDDLPECTGDRVAGIVVAVDPVTGIVTIDQGDGQLCTVMAGGDFDHPIVALLGSFFGEVSAENLTAALEATEVWVVCTATSGACELAEEGTQDAVSGRVVEVNGDELVVELEGGNVTVQTDDADLLAGLEEALAALTVDWTLQQGEDGPTVVDAGDQIAALHEDGMGFGVIVKLFAIASESQEACDDGNGDTPCGVTVDTLAEAFETGMGMGQLFEEFGKPAILGVGHVRNTARESDDNGR
jgi:hypothetical protein